MIKFNILILDDEEIVCRSLQRVLAADDREIFLCHNRDQARQVLNNQSIDLLLVDYKLGADDGLSVIREVTDSFPEIAVIMITAHGNIELAVDAMKMGAWDFIQKKEKPDLIQFRVQRALDNMRLRKEVDDLRELCRSRQSHSTIIAESPVMKQVIQVAGEFASADTTVLITGETGVGKNVLAELIHQKSPRFNHPLVTLNCSALPPNLIESELFGYEKGAFTGARQQGKKGLVEQAHNGTLFLDEIGELSLETQAKLLHVLEQGEFLRLGSLKPTRVDVRFIAATNADPMKKVDDGLFRLDLYYRLNVATLHLPGLRQRPQDIIPLAKLFIDHYNRKFSKNVREISPEAAKLLQDAPWQGNIRELKNLIERVMLLKRDEIVQTPDLHNLIARDYNHIKPDVSDQSFDLTITPDKGKNLLHEAQREVILKSLQSNQFNISKTAKFLGLPRTSLNSAMQRFGIDLDTTK